jgi:hypothetical protein
VSECVCVAAHIIILAPVFYASVDGVPGTLKSILVQSLLVLPLIETALQGFDNTSMQLTWRDLAPDEPNATIVYQWNADAADVGALSFVRNVSFAQRQWQFEFHNVLGASTALKAADGAVLGVLIVAQILTILFTILFIRNRWVSGSVCIRLCLNCVLRLHSEKQERAASLLGMVVPDHVTKELVSHVHLKDDGTFALDEDTLIARAHRRVALCFVDICDFTAIASVMAPNRFVLYVCMYVCVCMCAFATCLTTRAKRCEIFG